VSAHVTELALAASLLAASVIHLIPALGAISVQRLRALYGIEPGDPVLVLLLRHRALLFGVLGVFFLGAVWVPGMRIGAAAVALFSMLSFVLLAGGEARTAAIGRVVRVDLVVSAMLGIALPARLLLV
jgi:hypothetical protein